MNRTAVWLLLFMTGALAFDAWGQSSTSASYLNLPLAFEANQGQADARVRFIARGAGYALYLASDEAVLSLQGEAQPLRLKLVGANPQARIAGYEMLPGKSNYLRGNDPARWITGVPQYRRVKYASVYPGIDLVYYGDRKNGGRLEYDFVVAPGADPRQIRLALDGSSEHPKMGHIEPKSGDLLLAIGHSEIRNLRPQVYQYVNGRRREVSGRYLLAGSRVGFALGEYDRSQPLVIDPVILYATVLGSSGASSGLAVAVDGAGNAYVTGSTTDGGFPTVNAFQGALVAQKDVFVSKVNAAGTALVYSTYLGGSGSEEAHGIALDAAGNVYIAGYTQSSDFPTHTPLQASLAGTINAFVTKLNSTGSALVYSTYLGGSFIDSASGIAVDSTGSAYVAGYTLSTNFPTVSPLQSTLNGNSNAFIAKINPTGSALVYSTYLGGTGSDAAYAIAIDSNTNVYVAGSTSSTNFPTMNPIQAASGGNGDIFVTKLNAAGSALMYSTYYGGAAEDDAYGIALDVNNNVYVSGFTASLSAFPTFGALPPPSGTQGGVLVKLNPAGSAVVYATTLDSNGKGVAVDSYGNAYLTGRGLDQGGSPATVALRVNASGSALDYSFQLGSALTDVSEAIALDSSGSAYISGQGFIDTTLNPPASNSSSSTFVSLAKIGDAAGAPHIGFVAPAKAIVGASGATLQVFGTGFVSGATVQAGGADRVTTFVSSTEADATLLSTDLAAATTITISVTNSGGSPSNTVSFTIVNPPPVISSLSPSSANAGNPLFTLTVTGTGFLAGSVVYWNGSARSTAVVNSTTVTAQISSADISAGGVAQVQVNAPSPGGGLSAGVSFDITNPAPSITSLSPASLNAGAAAFQLTVQGSGFTQSSVVQWNGSPRTTTFVSTNQLKAAILAADVTVSGGVTVAVVTPTPGGGSASTTFNVTGNSVPVIGGLSPSSVIAGSSAFTLAVNGSGFVSTSQVSWNASPRATSFVNSSQLTILVAAADIANIGSAAITVVSPAPGGGASNSVSFPINGNAAPTVSGISPATATAGSAGFTLTVTGTGFVTGSSVYWNGSSRVSNIVNSTTIAAQILSQDIADGGSATVQVFVPAPGGGLSTPAETFSIVDPAPAISTLSPNTLPVSGSGFVLTVNGSGFTPSSKVLWNGSNRATSFTSTTLITASILAADLTAAGTATVTVFNQTPGGGTSNGSGFTIAANPAPSIGTITPSVIGAGTGSFNLTVNGSGFISGSMVQWNATNRATTFVSATQLTAAISANDVSGVGTATVTVVNAAPGGGTSNSATLTISSGCIYFLTPSATSFPAASSNASVTVNAPAGCTWTAMAVDSFLNVTAGASGSGGGVVSFTVAANTGIGRIGTLAIAGQNVVVSQGAAIQGVVSPGAAGAAPAATAAISVTAVLNSGASADKIAFSLQVTPNSSAPALSGSLSFVQNAALPAPSTIDTSGGPGLISVSWLSLPTPISGTTNLGFVILTLPSGAANGQTYTVQITGATASYLSNGVALSAGNNSIVTVVPEYLVGDPVPSTGNSVGQFGDGVINTLDLLATLRAATGVPGSVPPTCSDLFDAMDAFPPDSTGVRGGDGVINTLDLLTVLRRATGVDPARPRRVSRGLCSVQPQELRIGKAEGAIEIENDAVYLRAIADLNLAGLAVSLGFTGGIPLTWSAADGLTPSLMDDALPGVVAVAWLNSIEVRAGNRLLLGRLPGANRLKVFGSSAHAPEGRTVTIRTPVR